MTNRQNDKIFRMQWIIANTMSSFFGFFIWLIFKLWIDNTIKSDLDYWLKSTAYVISFASIGIIIGLAQWLLLIKNIPTISWLWILGNIPGLCLGIISTFLACFFTVLFTYNFFPGASGLAQLFLTGSIGGAIGGAIGGIITGIIQHILIVNNFSVNRLWIIASTVGWSLSWTLVFIGSPVFNEVGSFFGIPPSRSSDMFGVPLPFFGIIFGFINAMITGKVLVRFLRQSRQSRPRY